MDMTKKKRDNDVLVDGNQKYAMAASTNAEVTKEGVNVGKQRENKYLTCESVLCCDGVSGLVGSNQTHEFR